MSVLPKTLLGKWSVGLIILFFLLLATGMFVVSVLGQTGGETIFDNLWISIPMLGAGACAIAAFIVGGFSIVKNHERAISVLIAAILGLIILIFVLGEFLTPH